MVKKRQLIKYELRRERECRIYMPKGVSIGKQKFVQIDRDSGKIT